MIGSAPPEPTVRPRPAPAGRGWRRGDVPIGAAVPLSRRCRADRVPLHRASVTDPTRVRDARIPKLTSGEGKPSAAPRAYRRPAAASAVNRARAPVGWLDAHEPCIVRAIPIVDG